MATRRTLIAGNWKMHGLRRDLVWAARFRAQLAGPACEIVVCPPATLIGALADTLSGSDVALGGQDCAANAEEGPHTGDISARMLADLGCRYVIVGHSERRETHYESDALVRAKAEAAISAGLVPIICVGERLEEREAGKAEAVVLTQLAASLPRVPAGEIVIAYEPVWAIGTGLNAGPDEAQAMHAAIRAALGADTGERTRILYGGSVKPANAADLLACPDVDGALVGGASLDPEAFALIVNLAS